MKMLKKLSFVVCFMIAAVLVTGCGASKNVEGTLEEIMTKVYADIPEENRPMGLANTEVTEENVEYFLGTADIEYKEALASESMIGSIAHSVVLVRTEKNADIEAIKTKIKSSVNPRKWICVGVEEDEVIVKNKGDLIILIMAQSDSDKLEQAFDNL